MTPSDSLAFKEGPLKSLHWKSWESRVVDERYHLIRLLGVGGFGGVFRADEVVCDRLIRSVALKLIVPHPSMTLESQIDELVFSIRLDHPALLRYFSAGHSELDGVPLLYLAAELADETLEQRLDSGPIDVDMALGMATDIGAALEYLHGPNFQLVHRDLKPSNVLRIGGRWKLSDFGAVRSYGPDVSGEGAALGTPEYAPPESYDGIVSPAWDLWSFGVILTEALSGNLPFNGETPVAIREAVRTREPRLPDDLRPPFPRIIQGCLIKNREARWTADRVLEALSTSKSSASISMPSRPSIASPVSRETVESGTHELRCMSGHDGWVESVAFASDGLHALSGSRDSTVRLWDLMTGSEARRFSGHSGPVLAVALSPDGRTVLSGGEDGTVRVWDVGSGYEIRRYSEHTNWVSCVAFSPDGGYAVSGSWDASVRYWDVISGRTYHCCDGHNDWVSSVAFLNDGRRIVSGSWDDTIRVWNADIGRNLHSFSAGIEAVTSVTAAPNSRYILFSSGDSTARVWDIDRGEEVQVLRGHEGMVWSATFSPDGSKILTGGDDRTVRLWESRTGMEIALIGRHAHAVRSVAFSPDGRLAVSGGRDGAVRLWDLNPFQQQRH